MYEKAIERAWDYFGSDYNCAQSVLKTVLEERDIKTPLATYIAAGFGGGMGRCGETCGAVSGAVIAIGMLLERNYPEPLEHKKKAYEYTKEFIRQFRDKHGTLKCNDLLGLDISTPEGHEKGEREGTFKERCPNFVKTAVTILLDMFPSCNPC